MTRGDTSRASWQVGPQRVLTLNQPRLMGILNVTPDSFFDGAKYGGPADAVAAALRMRDEGAAIIDVGGESTRPSAQPVDCDEQIRRTIPVIEGIRRADGPEHLLISIDTTDNQVAQAALDAGADIINDVSAGRDDDRMFALASARGCGIILMHRRTTPQRDSYSTQYVTDPDYGGDVVGFIGDFLMQRCQAALDAGISHSAIVIDPGLGFGKSVEQNYDLAGTFRELGALGYPVLSAASRKSFLGALGDFNAEASQRLAGSLALSMAHYLAGVRLFRVHDVAAHAQAFQVLRAIGSKRASDPLIGEPARS